MYARVLRGTSEPFIETLQDEPDERCRPHSRTHRRIGGFTKLAMKKESPPDWRRDLIRAVRDNLASPSRTARLVALLLAVCLFAVAIAWSYQAVTGPEQSQYRIIVSITTK